MATATYVAASALFSAGRVLESFPDDGRNMVLPWQSVPDFGFAIASFCQTFPLPISTRPMKRRAFLAHAAVAAAAGTLIRPTAFAAAARSGRPPRILLRSSWQSVNIGDIGHTP